MGGTGNWVPIGGSSGGGHGASSSWEPIGAGGGHGSHHHGGGFGGFLHSVAHPFEKAAHYTASKASLAGHDIAAIPGGTYSMVKAALPTKEEIEHPLRFDTKSAKRQWGGFLTHPIREQHHAARGDYGKEAQSSAAAVGGLIGGAKTALRHPLRDPFQTALTVSPVLHGVGRAGEIASGVDATAPRVLRMGEEHVPLPPTSRNAGVRALQRGYANRLQHALDTNPESRLAAHAAKRIGGSLNETGRYQARMRAVPVQLLQHAGRELRGTLGKRIPFSNARAAEAALRLTSENSTAEEAAAFHRAEAARGVEPRANEKLAKLYEHIHKSGLLKHGAEGNVVVDAAKAPKLAEADAALARAQRDAERIVHEHGLMGEEAQRARLNAPSEIRAGHRDVAEAQARLAELDKWHSGLLEKMVPHVSPYADKAREQLRRNFENSRAGKGRFRALTRQPTVKADELALAEDKLHELIAEHPDAPRVAEARHLVEERASLVDFLNRHAEASMFGEPEPGLNGIAREGRGYVPYRALEPKASRGAVARTGSSGVVGKARSPIASTQHFTGEALRQGQIPDATTALVARHLQRLHRFVNTDALRRKVLGTGSDVKRTSREILVRIPDKAAGKIPIEIERDLGRKHVTLDELSQLEGHNQALADKMHDLVRGGFNADAATQDGRLAPALAEARRYGIGEAAPKGYRWVDRNIFGDLGNAFALSRGRVGRFGDAVNSAVTTATVYLKPGHLPQRTLTNAGTTIIQGAAAPTELGRSVRLWRSLSHEDRMRALGAAGQGGYEAMPHEGEGFVGRTATKAAHWWTKHIDAPFRFASIAYEARKVGYRTAPEFRRFLHVLEQPDRFPKDEALRADAVAKEANRAGIAYDRMSDTERRTIGRMIWFYPWIRNASLYTGRVFASHPFKASLLAQLGVEGRKQQQDMLGDLPSYEYGLTPVGHNRVSDIGRLFPLSTAADLLQVPEHPAEVGGYANPAISGLLGALFNLDSFESQGHGSRFKTALGDLVSPLPESSIYRGYQEHGQDQSRRMFPNSGGWAGIEDPALRALLGTAYPRRINPTAAHSAAARERTGR